MWTCNGANLSETTHTVALLDGDFQLEITFETLNADVCSLIMLSVAGKP
jgi:hypothetical protein